MVRRKEYFFSSLGYYALAVAVRNIVAKFPNSEIKTPRGGAPCHINSSPRMNVLILLVHYHL
jgi:hypothetical protein